MTCFLEGPLVVILSLGHDLWLMPWAILWILMIFFGDSLGKASLTFRMSSALPFVAWANDFMPSLDLASLDLARTVALGLGGIGGGILEIFAGWGLLLVFESVGFPLLNCDATHCQKVLELLSAKSLSHPGLYIAEIRSQAAKPKSEIWGMSRLSLSPRGLCLMKVAILWREHAMFLASPSKTSTVTNREIELKLLSHNIGSAGWLAWYGMAEGSRLGG